MENLVPLGTGNSRLMKSNIPSNTTLAQLIQMWNNGTFPYDIGPLNSAGISQQGTPLNKDTLLKDATAALFGLGSDAVPDDVLAKLAEAAFVEDGVLTDIDGNIVAPQIATGSYVGTGTAGASNPNSISLSFPAKCLIVRRVSNANQYISYGLTLLGTGQTVIEATATDAGNNRFVYVTSFSNIVRWYATTQNGNDVGDQMNIQGQTYNWIAIG